MPRWRILLPVNVATQRHAFSTRCALCALCWLFALGCANFVTPPDAGLPPAPPPTRPAQCATQAVPGHWTRVTDASAPSPRTFAASVRVGARLLVWGGLGPRGEERTDGALYDPRSDAWEPVPAGAPGGDRRRLTVAALGERVFVWELLSRRGAIFDVRTRTWTPVPDAGAPRFVQRAVGMTDAWFVWSLGGTGEHNSASVLSPDAARWRELLPPLRQDARNSSAITWTGTQVLVWGGTEASFSTQPPRNDGYRYSPSDDQWSSVENAGAPSPRWGAELFWTGLEALVWGGNNGSRQLWDGGLYDPVDDRWRALPSASAVLATPTSTIEASSAWTGCTLFVWAGALPDSGARAAVFDRYASQWMAAAQFPGTAAIEGVVVGAAGESVLVWGGARGTGASRVTTGEGWRWTATP